MINKTILMGVMVAIVSACGSQEPNQVATADKEATRETVALYDNLSELSSNGTMIGHQDALAYGVGWYGDDAKCDFKDASGQFPAVFGWEIGELEYGQEYSLDSVYFDKIKEYMKRVYDMGGVNTVSWHTRNPLTGGDAWDVSSKEVVASVLPGGVNHATYTKWLDTLSDFFLDLRGGDGNAIPVIFRPYHELTGSWFWWGKDLCSPQQYVELWKMTVDYMKQKGVHNILWAYSVAGFDSQEEFLDRYPGDDYVDLIGFDSYQMSGGSEFVDAVTKQAELLTTIAQKHNKIAALTELGFEGLKDSMWYSNVLYPIIEGKSFSYVLLWRNAYDRPGHFYTSYPGHSSCADLESFVNRDDVLTVDNIKGIYSKR